MSKLFNSALLGLSLGICAASVAAQDVGPNSTLVQIAGKGKILVNQGEGFVAGAEGMRLSPGDRVMAQDDSSAQIKFDDQCERTVEENTIATVPDRSNCAGGVWGVQGLNPGSGTAIGTTAAGTATGNGGVLAMVGIVAAIDLWWLNEGDDDTVSP